MNPISINRRLIKCDLMRIFRGLAAIKGIAVTSLMRVELIFKIGLDEKPNNNWG